MRASEIREAATVSFGERIVANRLARGLTQAQLSELTGVSVAAISGIENDRLVPAVLTIRRLAFGLDIPTERLLTELPTRSTSKEVA